MIKATFEMEYGNIEVEALDDAERERLSFV